MPSFTTVFTNILLASCAFASPFTQSIAARSFGKRDAVCALDFRALVDKSSCLPNKQAFTLTKPSTINDVTLPDENLSSVPSGVQCDHTIEIQLLDSVAQNSGLCAVLTALVAADSSQSKATLLGPASEHISDVSNLNFLDASVNGNKKTVVQRSLKNKAQGSTDLDKAVGNYLAEVGAASLGVAATLDADLAAIMTQARTVLAGLPDGKSSRDPATVVKRNLQNAINAFSSSQTVTAAWNKVLTDAPHS